MKTSIIIKTVSLTLLVALCTMGCKHKSIDDIVLPPEPIPIHNTDDFLSHSLSDSINAYLDGDKWLLAAMSDFLRDTAITNNVDSTTVARLQFNYKVREAIGYKKITKGNNNVEELLNQDSARSYLKDKYDILKLGLSQMPTNNGAGTILGNALGSKAVTPFLTYKEIKDVIEKLVKEANKNTKSEAKEVVKEKPPQKEESIKEAGTEKNNDRSAPSEKCTCKKGGRALSSNTTLFSVLQNPSIFSIDPQCPKHGKYEKAVNDIKRYYSANRDNYTAIYSDVSSGKNNNTEFYKSGEPKKIYDNLKQIKESKQ